MTATRAETVPISLLGEVTLGKMVQPNRKNETDELRPYLRAAHLPAPGTLSLDVSEQQMYFSPAERDRLNLQEGDVVIVEGGAGYGRSAYLDNDLDGWGFQNSIVRVRPYPGVSIGRYVYYALQHAQADRQIELEVSTATLPHFTAEKVGRFRLPLPPLETQRAIADYLDRETAEVDAMSADLDEMEALLTERRGSVSTVLIGRLEGRSETRRVSLSVVADLISSNVDKKSREGELPVRLVNYTDVYYGDTLTSDADYMRATATPEQIGRVGVRDGDVVFTKDSETADDIGIPALVLNPDTDMVCGYHLTIARPRRELVNPRYLYWTFMSGQAKSHWEQVANGVTRFSIGSSATSGLPVLLPPLEVQRRVADEIDRETAEIDAMLADITELRDLLAERRAAVIAAAVTGHIDVPTTQETTNG